MFGMHLSVHTLLNPFWRQKDCPGASMTPGMSQAATDKVHDRYKGGGTFAFIMRVYAVCPLP